MQKHQQEALESEETFSHHSFDLNKTSITKSLKPDWFIFLDLKPNISRINVLSFYLMCFALYLNIQFITSFIIFILKSPDYYNIGSD